jgi:hypothetical protein
MGSSLYSMQALQAFGGTGFRSDEILNYRMENLQIVNYLQYTTPNDFGKIMGNIEP